MTSRSRELTRIRRSAQPRMAAELERHAGDASTTEVRRTTAGPIGVGSEHVFVRRFAGRRIESRNRFVEFEPGRFVAFEIPDGKMTGRASYLVEPLDTERCHLTSAMHFHVAGWMRIAEPLLTWILERDSRRDEQTFKRLLESTST